MPMVACGKVALATVISRLSCSESREGFPWSLLLSPKLRRTFCTAGETGVLCFRTW